MGFATRYRSELDEPVAREFDALYTMLRGFLLEQHNEDGSHRIPGLKTSEQEDVLGASTEVHHWRRGPWTFDDGDAPDPNVAFIRPPNLPTGTYNDFNCQGFQTCIGVEFEPDGAITITGMEKPSPYRKRVMIIENSDSTNNITISHDSSSSKPGNRFKLPGDVDVVLAPHQVLWVRYDLGIGAWFAAITPHEEGGLSGGGGSSTVIPSIYFQTWDAWTIAMGLTPTSVVSMAGSTLVSTNNDTESDYTAGIPYKRVSAAANTAATNARINVSGTPSAAGTTPQLSVGFTMDMWIRSGDSLDSVKYWMGVFVDASPTISSDTAPSTNFLAFRYVNGTDTKWKAVTRNGTTTTTSDVGSASVAVDTVYHLRIRVPAGGTTIYFSVDEGTEVAMTADLPATTSVFYPSENVHKIATGGSVTRRFGHHKMLIRYADPSDTPAAEGLAAAVTCVFDGAGEALVSGKTIYVRVPYGMTISGWDIVADVSGSAVVKVFKDSYTNYPPVAADEISGSGERPTLSSAIKNQDTALTTWTTLTLGEGEYLAFHLDSVSTCEWVGVQLYGVRV